MVKCTFCGKPETQARRMLTGNNASVCDECVVQMYNLIAEDDEKHGITTDISPLTKAQNNAGKYRPKPDIGSDVITPAAIKNVLDMYVIGQEAAKRTICVAVYNHYKRTMLPPGALSTIPGLNKDDIKDVEVQKSNVLLLGPTGVGKTMIAQTLAKCLKVPFAIADATTLTQAGYVGEDVENVLLRLIQAADYDIPAAEKGIIYIDEIDKISRLGENMSITRDVSGEGVQQALLKIIEGTVSNVPPNGGRKNPHQDFLQIDTHNILFICGGAFDGLEKSISRRIHSSALGFGTDIKTKAEKESSENLHNVEPEDLVKYGLIPELIGRLPVIATLDALTAENLVSILKEPKNALMKQYRYLFALDGIQLEAESDALTKIAEKAIKRKTGARGLRTIMEEVLSSTMFDTPGNKNIDRVIITPDCISLDGEKAIANPTVIYKIETDKETVKTA
ncbi:MAG: ATP-dependent Clp protease ATP-binding subunit ClpX [Oscillospiraceae bacterium]|nr:ATP-dependent Clp protease ATP-binding subunit ClpX [Oscillospiraceae bacterium]